METAETPPTSDRFRIEWTSQSAIKRVAITDLDSGRRYVGSDWASWDIAYREAVQKALHGSTT